MGIKKKIGMGVASAALGIALVGGGTFAYFSDTAVQANEFASGTLDLSVNPTTQVKMDNIKPGDWMPRTFKLQNKGSLDIKYVDLKTDYTVTKDGVPVSDELADKFAEQLYVQFLNNTTGNADHQVLYEVSLKDLRDLTPEDLATKVDLEHKLIKDGYSYYAGFWPFGHWVYVDPVYKDIEKEDFGIKVGETHDFDVQFRFNDTGEAQNDLQGLDLDLEWTFEGYQTDGEQK